MKRGGLLYELLSSSKERHYVPLGEFVVRQIKL